ncbi:hypothetical protein ACTHUE_20400, partial [Neisseria sp. P0021.S005]|uniref:hypothetical protein n=1 Tax=Neisseria sp. P0021.S005 TaxID=3436820 RepID=UPI003F81F81F
MDATFFVFFFPQINQGLLKVLNTVLKDGALVPEPQGGFVGHLFVSDSAGGREFYETPRLLGEEEVKVPGET